MNPEFRQHLLEVRNNARQLYSAEQIDEAISRMAQQINRDYAEHDPLMLTIMNGGVVLMGKLLCRSIICMPAVIAVKRPVPRSSGSLRRAHR